MHFIIAISASSAFVIPFIWSIILGSKATKGDSNRYAFYFFLSISIVFFGFFADSIRYLPLSIAINVIYPFFLNISPILYIYFIYYLSTEEKKIKKPVHIVFVIPLAQFIFSGYAFYLHQSIKELSPFFYDVIYEQPDKLPDSLYLAYIAARTTSLLMIIGLISAVVISIYFIPTMINNIRQEYSNIQERLIMRFLILLSVSFVLCMGSIIQFTSIDSLRSQWQLLISGIFWAGGWLLSGYLINRELNFKNKIIDLPKPVELPSSQLREQLIHYFNTKKPYLVPDLKINDVAIALHTNRAYLSDLLNKELKTNFNAFVNQYRVNEVKQILDNCKGETKIHAIILRSGFNSYPTFYRAFKEITGNSPADYLEKAGNPVYVKR